jgi:hypothetical protein
MNIQSAIYKKNVTIKGVVTEENNSIVATIDGAEWSVPLDPANRHYQAILEWAKIDGNTIEDAD